MNDRIIHSTVLRGIDAVPVTFRLVPGRPVEPRPGESPREWETNLRIRSALQESGVVPPNLYTAPVSEPADVRGWEATDLARALLLASAALDLPAVWTGSTLAVGELGLGGQVRPVRGTLAASAAALDRQLSFLAPDNAHLAPGCPGLFAAHLRDAIEWLLRQVTLSQTVGATPAFTPPDDLRLSEVRGQEAAKAALVRASVTGRSLLLVGPPGCGKTMLARRLLSVLPCPDDATVVQVQRVYDAAGLPLPTWRPFRAPHHTVSSAGLFGGGHGFRPGEASLAHGGVLFLDEVTKFSREALGGLREALRLGYVQASWAVTAARLPTKFLLVGAANPCPCGWRGSATRTCACGAATLARYDERLGELQRDLFQDTVEVNALDRDTSEEATCPRSS